MQSPELSMKKNILFLILLIFSTVSCQSFRSIHNNALLIDAINKNDHKKVLRAIALGADVNQRLGGGGTPLMIAVEHDDVELIDILLRNGAILKAEDLQGQTALFDAAYYHSNKVLRFLIEKGANIHVKDYWDTTALLRVCDPSNIKGDKVGTAKILIENGVDINVPDKEGYTPIFKASSSGNIELVKLLLKNGANPNIQTNYGDPPLDITKCSDNKKIVHLLIEAGAKTAEELKH
jgi:ankyrin repeat protein